jgi:putative transposase
MDAGVGNQDLCLMTNHIHIVADPGDDAMVLSTLMKRINGRQAAYVNK